MNKNLVKKLRATSKGVKKIAELSEQPKPNKPEGFMTKWSRIFETVVDIVEIYEKH